MNAIHELEKDNERFSLSSASGKCERRDLRQQILKRISSPTAEGRRAEAQARASVTQTAELRRKVSSPIQPTCCDKARALVWGKVGPETLDGTPEWMHGKTLNP